MQSFQFFALVPGRASTLFRILSTITLAVSIQFVPMLQDAKAQTPQRGPLKFDPLTPEERELATRLAEADPRVKRLRGTGRQLLISVELATPKTADENSRHAEVLYYRYVGNQGVLALINLQQRAVQETVAVDGNSVPLSNQEVNQALNIALQNRTLINLLGPNYQQYRIATQNQPEGEPNRVEALRILASSRNDRCYRHRCVSLLFRQGDTFLTGTSVIVDLTLQNVRVEQPAPRRHP
jgi:hypothetical protein